MFDNSLNIKANWLKDLRLLLYSTSTYIYAIQGKVLLSKSLRTFIIYSKTINYSHLTHFHSSYERILHCHYLQSTCKGMYEPCVTLSAKLFFQFYERLVVFCFQKGKSARVGTKNSFMAGLSSNDVKAEIIRLGTSIFALLQGLRK